MSQAGRPAPAPGVRRASKQGPCREAGQGIKGDREEVGCGGCERPSRARGWGGPGPGPSAPPRAAGNAQQSQATRGGKVKSGRPTAFFKHTSRRCRSRKTKLSHLGERWKNTQRAWSPPPRARAGAAGPRPAASPPPGFPTPGPRPSGSLRPSLAHPGRHSQEGQGHSCPEPGRPVSGSMSAAIKVWASVSPSARRRVCSLSRS